MPDATNAKKSFTLAKTAARLLQSQASNLYGLNLQPAPPEQPGAALHPSDLPNGPARWPEWRDAMRSKHHWRYQGCFSRVANLSRSLTTPVAAGLLLILAALLAIMPASAQAQDNAQSATYRVTFTGKFTDDALASGVSVPSGAHFTTLIGAVHNGSVTFWSDGGTASAGIESMAEIGGTVILRSEINAAMPNALAVISKSIASGGTATATVDITLTTDHPLVTLTSMIAPSPDWFVGVSGLSLRNAADDGWQPSLTVDLFPWDAGTEDGTEFSLSNTDSSPQGTITSIKGTGKFSDEPIATLTFTLQPELILAASPAAIVEAGGSATVTVEITNGATFAEDQEIALSFAGTATKGTDYTVALESPTLTAGQSSVATTVTAVQDMVDDDAETILITASHGGGTIGAEQTITIIDDDPTPCSGGMAGTYPCSNVDLMSFLPLADIGGGGANDIWGWTDSSTGKEYAIMGRTNGTSFVDVSDPVNPIYLGDLPPHSSESTWRDVKVYADHAFIVTEADDNGMQVFDLTQLRMVASPPATFSETAHYSGFSTAHNLAINEDSGFAYAVGSNTCSGGLHMIDIQTPTSPTSAGCFSADGHTHDAQCVNYDGPDDDHQGKEICFNSNVDTLTIVDVTNKAAPAMLSRTGYTGSRYAHQGWLTEDHAYFLLDDEYDETFNPDVTNTRTYMWDVSDLDAPAVIGFHDSTTTATDHNQYVKGKYTYQSNYRAGLRILDITDIANGNLSEEAFFDIFPGSDSTSFNGAWSNYPFFDSGIVIVSGMEQGLFILRPNLVDSVNPALASAAVNGAALTLTYGEALDENSTPATDAFTVTVAGSGRMVTHVSVIGKVVTLTLASVVAHYETVTVSYSPGTNPIQDAVGNDAAMLSNEPVTNNSPDTTAPTIDGIAISSNPPGNRDTYAIGNVIEAAVTFDETVVVTGRPQLTLNVGGQTKPAIYDRGSNSDTLVFAYPVASGDLDTDGVSLAAGRIDLNGGTIQDGSDNDAELDHDAVAADTGHKVEGVKPALASTGGVVVNGTTLTLTYDEPLDGSSTPDLGDFTVSGGDQARTVTRVSVSGSTVVLTLDVGAEHLEAGIQVSYTPGTNPIRDLPGNQAEGLSREPVTNETPDTTPPEVSSLAVSSNPVSDQTYAAGDEIEVTVTFNETVKVTGTPRLTLRVGNRNRAAGYQRGTGTAALVFGYEVVEGDEDGDGVSIRSGRIALNGGTIQDEAENSAELAYRAVLVRSGHQVDGVRPAFVSAAVDGASLALTYGEALDGGSEPASGDFTVTVGGSGRTVNAVDVDGSTVTLTLNPAVEHGDTGIRVSYTVPTGVGANPIRDAVGNDARGLSNRSVTNTTGAPNTDPEITSPSSFNVPENRMVARRLAARDTDPGDEVTGWAIAGGADQSEFSIASDTGELSFRDAPDFEAPGDNEYEVTVEVTSGTGARELTVEKTFTITVTDEREPPGVPEAPTFSGETADSLTVNWSEPDNTGPPITDYDVQYRENGRGGFRDGGHEGPGLSLTLSDLEPGTAYEVQVKARNDEGASDWSESGDGKTVTPLTLEMMTMEESPVSGPFAMRFSYSEPVTAFNASDIDSGQDPDCVDDQNNTIFCDPGIGALESTDDRIFTTTVTPWTDRVAHSYRLTLTVEAGSVSSSVGSKLNEEPEELLVVRVSPPGAPEPISTLSLGANGANGSVRLSWNRPSDNGGSAIIRYEYRFAPAGEAWSDWENVGAGARGVTVGNLVNGREYVFEVRAVNALGKGGAETVRAVPERRITPPPPPPPPGNGGGGGLLFPPEAPLGLMAMPGDGAVRLEWSPPENDGGTPILRYEYRLKEGRGEFGEWTPIPESAPDEVNAAGYTVMELGNGTVYVFELHAVNLVGNGRESEAVEVVMRLDRAYGSNFLAEDLEGAQLRLEGFFSGGSGDREVRFGAGLRFEEDELDGQGEVTATRMGSYGYGYTSRTTGELSLDFDGGEACEVPLTFREVGAGSYSYRCGGVLRGQGSFRLTGLNRGPEFTSTGPFEVVENQAVVGQLEAVDPDEQDKITGYGIAGGADAELFAMVEATGELSFRQPPDYENPGDVESAEPASAAGDNEYIVVVEVSSGEGERERKGSRAIRVGVTDEEEPPEITGAGVFEVAENRTRVGRLEAVDPDEGDEIEGYGITGGADAALFEVESETGELQFREAPDYENPSDVESAEPASAAGDNEYIVVVEVSSGEGERERKGSRAIRVGVTDEEEPPGAPAAPAVTPEGTDSLKVSWTEPENRGPEITDYEVRYREGGEAGYSDGGRQGTGLMVRLSGLKEGTVYEVQVRAVNEEGMGEWSQAGEGRTDMEEPDPHDPSDFTEEDIEGRRLTLRLEGEEGAEGIVELRFGEDNRFEQIESGGEQAATRTEGASRMGAYAYEWTGPGMGTVRLDYDDGASCQLRLSFTESGAGGFVYDCGEGDPAEGSFRLTTGSLFVPVILSSAGRNQSFFTSELTLTNRGEREVALNYTYTADRGGGSGTASDVLAAGRQQIETDALTYLRRLGVPIPDRGNRIGTLRVEVKLGSEVEAVARTTTVVPEGRAGLAYPGVAAEEGYEEAVYLSGLRQNAQDRSNVAFQNMGTSEEGAITLRTTVYSGEAADATARVLEEVELEPGGFHQYSGLLGVLGVPAQGYVKVERVEGEAPFYAYGVINDQANSDGSFVFPVTASSLEGKMGQTLPVVVETSEFTSELTVTNFSRESRTLDFEFVSEQVRTDDKTASFSMTLEAGEQEIVAEVVEALRRQEVAGLGTTRGFYAGPLFVVAEGGDMSGIVIGARTSASDGRGGSYGVFYDGVPFGEAFTKEAWVDGLQQNRENRSNLALVNTGEVDGSPSVFHLEIYDGETGMPAETVVTRPIPARGWHQINGILGRSSPETRQGYVRIEKVSGENPFLAYGVVNDGGAPGERSGDGAYLPARE